MLVKLDSKHRLTVPRALVAAQPDDQFEARFDTEEDAIIFRRVSPKRGWLSTWKDCPVAMDEIPARSTELPKDVEP